MAPGDLGSGHHSSDARLDVVVGQDLVPWPNNNDNEFDTGIGGMTANHSFSTAGSLNCSHGTTPRPIHHPRQHQFQEGPARKRSAAESFPA